MENEFILPGLFDELRTYILANDIEPDDLVSKEELSTYEAVYNLVSKWCYGTIQ